MKYSCMIVLALLWAGCGSKQRTSVLKPEEMKLIMWDMLRADEVASLEGVRDTIPNNLLTHAVAKYEQVFAIHQTNKEQFYHSYQYYQEHPEEHKILMDSLAAYGNRVKEMKEKKENAKRDSLQKAAHIADSLAGKKDTLSIKKDTLNKGAGKDSIKPMPLMRDTMKRPPVPMRPDTAHRRIFLNKMKPGRRSLLDDKILKNRPLKPQIRI